MQTPSPPPPLRSGGNFMKGAECAEVNGKNNIKKSPIFIFQVLTKFHRKLGWQQHQNDHNSKN